MLINYYSLTHEGPERHISCLARHTIARKMFWSCEGDILASEMLLLRKRILTFIARYTYTYSKLINVENLEV